MGTSLGKLSQDPYYSLMMSLREINMAVGLTPMDCGQKSIFQCSRGSSSSLRQTTINVTEALKMISRDRAIEVSGESRKLQSGRGSLFLGEQIEIEPEPHLGSSHIKETRGRQLFGSQANGPEFRIGSLNIKWKAWPKARNRDLV